MWSTDDRTEEHALIHAVTNANAVCSFHQLLYQFVSHITHSHNNRTCHATFPC
ncbi:hypothetical protein D3C74_506060 [compost metagenome]